MSTICPFCKKESECPQCDMSKAKLEDAIGCVQILDVAYKLASSERETLKAQVEELSQQDRLKTREINTLVPENLALVKERDELRAALEQTLRALENQKSTDDGYTVHDTPIKRARAVLAKTKGTKP